ncbi:hypothetical protein ACLIJ1_23255, partial [Hydrogenophaga sp. RWCD_12]
MKIHETSWVRAGLAGALSLLLVACGGGSTADSTVNGTQGASTAASLDRSEADASSAGNAAGTPNAQLNAQALAQAEAQAKRADSSQPLESLPPGAIASKLAYVSGAIARKATVVGAPAYRFYNAGTGAHFYTTNTTEADNLVADFSSPFHLEGPAFWVAKTVSSGLSPVHRFFNTRSGVHFYTISETERASLEASSSQYSYEGVAYYASQVAGAGLVPLYRFYVPSKGFHFYTTSESEKSSIQANLSATYRFEGVGYYVLDSASQTRAPELGQTSTSVVAQLQATRLSG